jgi:hypothetical protein
MDHGLTSVRGPGRICYSLFDVHVELESTFACEYARRKYVGRALGRMGIDTRYDLAVSMKLPFTSTLQTGLDARRAHK